jgi:hypothetical protein
VIARVLAWLQTAEVERKVEVARLTGKKPVETFDVEKPESLRAQTMQEERNILRQNTVSGDEKGGPQEP